MGFHYNICNLYSKCMAISINYKAKHIYISNITYCISITLLYPGSYIGDNKGVPHITRNCPMSCINR